MYYENGNFVFEQAGFGGGANRFEDALVVLYITAYDTQGNYSATVYFVIRANMFP